MSGTWNGDPRPSAATSQWHVTTQPNFVTKPKQPVDKVTPSWNKPKPTKKPTAFVTDPPPSPNDINVNHVYSYSSHQPVGTTTMKPKPQVSYCCGGFLI